MGIGVWTWVMLLMGVGVSWGQEAAPEAEKAAEKTVETKAEPPQTTGDPTIPVDQLEFLLKPLTKEELVVEADGWRDLPEGESGRDQRDGNRAKVRERDRGGRGGGDHG